MVGLLLVMAGGALGAGARHLFGRLTLALLGPGYPWGTLGVNILGGLAMGLFVGWMARAAMGAETLRLFAAVGVLGGFTTFSSFSLDTVVMIERGDWGTAIGYVLASVSASVLALAGGLACARALA